MNFPRPTKNYHTKPQAVCDPTRPENSAQGKVVLITGGGTGVGFGIAAAFAKAGAKAIVIASRSAEHLEKARAQLQDGYQGSVITYQLDVTDQEGVNRVFADVASRVGKIDVCVANAGYLPDLKPIKDSDFDDFWRGFEVNTKGVFLSAQAFLNNAGKDPVFVHMHTEVSRAGWFGPMGAYVASKTASAKIVEYLQQENPDIRAYNMAPGAIPTEMSAKAGLPEELFEDVNHPAWFTVWLASPQSAFLKGRFMWANWDVEELKQKEQEILNDVDFLTNGPIGWPYAN